MIFERNRPFSNNLISEKPFLTQKDLDSIALP